MDPNTFAPEKWTWLMEIAIVLGVVVVLSLALQKVISIIKKRAADAEGFWRRKIHHIFHLPLQVAIWGFGVAYAIDVMGTHYGFEASARYIRPLKAAFVAAALTWIALRWVKEAFGQFAKKSKKLGVAPGTIYAISKLVTFVISIIGLMVIFTIFNINILPLLTFGGIGVAGVAFAAQDIIANFFGGMMLHFTRNFSIGDMIVIPSKENFQGVVKEIGWYITVVEDYYRRPVYFPNALFSKANVINESRRTHRRLKGTITLRYDDLPNVEAIVSEMQSRIRAHSDVDETQSFSIQFSGYGEYGIDIYYYMLTHETRYLRFLVIKQEILLTMNEIVQKYGAEFCYPTHNVQMTQVLKP